MGNILIISHSFPPTPGIGGRRWAKFAKYLMREGFNVFIIAAQNVHKKNSEWTADISGMKVEYLPYRFPRVVSQSKFTFIDKIMYRFWLSILRIVNRGNFYDRAFFWKKQLERKIRGYVNDHKIDTVVVSGAPFLLTYYSSSLKAKFPGLKFIVDFRDLWTTDTEISAFSSLPGKRIAFERQRERATVMMADHVITVADQMRTYFESLGTRTKVSVVPNGYDPDDLAKADLQVSGSGNDKVSLVFAGTLYLNVRNIIEPFFNAISSLRVSQPFLFEKLEVNFYGNFPKEYIRLIDFFGLTDTVRTFGVLPLEEVYRKIHQASGCLLVLNDVYNFSLSTKFCEYIGLKKPVIVASHAGPASEFITQNGLGCWFDPDNPLTSFSNCLNAIVSGPPNPIPEHLRQKFSIPVITKEVLIPIIRSHK